MAVDVEALYKRYGPMVLRRCRYLLGEEEKAVDAMQDVFVEVLRRKDLLDARAPSSLLYTMATNLCLNILRSERRKPSMPATDILTELPSQGDFTERVSLNSILEAVFSEEKESTRLIAVLHYLDGLTLEETAKHTGLSISGVRKRLRKIREKALRLVAA